MKFGSMSNQYDAFIPYTVNMMCTMQTYRYLSSTTLFLSLSHPMLSCIDLCTMYLCVLCRAETYKLLINFFRFLEIIQKIRVRLFKTCYVSNSKLNAESILRLSIQFPFLFTIINLNLIISKYKKSLIKSKPNVYIKRDRAQSN